MPIRANIHLVGNGTAARRKVTSLTRRNQCVVERYILWNGLSCSLATRDRSFQDESDATRLSNLSSTSFMVGRLEGSDCVISSTSGRRNSKPKRLELSTPPVTERCPCVKERTSARSTHNAVEKDLPPENPDVSNYQDNIRP